MNMIKYGLITFLILGLVGSMLYYKSGPKQQEIQITAQAPSIKIGLFFALNNTYISEQPSLNAALLAIDEVNERGGVLGRKVEPIIIDCSLYDAKKLEDVLTTQQAQCIIAGGSCGTRRQAQEVIERLNSLLVYTKQSEGLMDSNHSITIGSVLNQTVIPSVTWAVRTFGKRLYIVSNQELLSATAQEMAKEQAMLLGAQIVGSANLNNDGSNVLEVITSIQEMKPDVVINTLYGAVNSFFYKGLRQSGITPDTIATITLNSDERELQQLPESVGDYTIANYFSTVNHSENALFLKKINQKFGESSVVDSNAQCSYCAVHIWAQAVNRAQALEKEKIILTLKTAVFNGPNGVVCVDPNLYTWNPVLIGKGLFNGKYNIVWGSNDAIHPEPYPPYKSKTQWNNFLTDLYGKWGNSWLPN